MAKLLLTFFMLFGVAVLSGCWDYRDIETRANIVGVAIDVASIEEVEKEGEITHENNGISVQQQEPIRMTVQIAIPGRIPLGSGGEQGGGGQESVWVLDVAGRTLDDAWQNLEQQLSLPVFLGNLRVIIVSEEVAKKGLVELNDFLRRNAQVRRNAWLVISKEKAVKYMEAAPELDRIPALYLVTAIDEAIDLGKFPNDFLGVAWSKHSSLGQEPILPYLTLKEKGNIEISGLAYTRNGKVIGVTSPLDIGRYMAIQQINPGGYSVMTAIPEHNATVMFKSDQRKSKINIEINNDLPHVKITVHLEGEIEEKINQQFNLNPETIKELEETIEKGSEKTFSELITKTQIDQSDIFGFGEQVRAKHSNYWDEKVKTKEKWSELYKDLPIDVEVTVSLRRIGMKNK